MVRHMNLNRMKRKKASYLKSTICTFLRYKNKRLDVKIDGEDLPTENYMIGAIANGQVFGKGMRAAPDAKLDDGVFDVLLVKGMKMLEFLRTVKRLYAGTHLPHPKIDLIHAQKVEVSPAPEETQDVLIEVDGEQVGQAPVTFEILPGCFPVKANL